MYKMERLVRECYSEKWNFFIYWKKLQTAIASSNPCPTNVATNFRREIRTTRAVKTVKVFHARNYKYIREF